jgi:AbiV family abortive infection protein
MHLCFKNAENLLNDAETLRSVDSPRALSISILALEEIGKIILLCNAAAKSTNTPGFWKRVKKRAFGSHRRKQRIIASYGSALLNKMQADGAPFYKNQIPSEIMPLLDRFKQWGFYVDFVSGGFQDPKEFVESNTDWLNWVLVVTRERLESIRPMHEAEEMSVWIARTTGSMVDMLKSSESEKEFNDRMREFLKRNPKPSVSKS